MENNVPSTSGKDYPPSEQESNGLNLQNNFHVAQQPSQENSFLLGSYGIPIPVNCF